jgi:hypothetical protein
MVQSGTVKVNESLSTSFDLVRLTRAKRAVDVCPNTIRAYAKEGLNLYRKGRAVFFSRAELDTHIRSTADKVAVEIKTSTAPARPCRSTKSRARK